MSDLPDRLREHAETQRICFGDADLYRLLREAAAALDLPENQKVTGDNDGLLCQDCDRKLSRWFASRPGARSDLRAALEKPEAEPVAWQRMRTAPRDGTAVLVLVEGSDIPRAARWLRGTDDPHATAETEGPGWHLTWDGTPVAEHEGPRYWMHCPDDPDDAADSDGGAA